MNERLAAMDDDALGGSLAAALGALDWPETPDVAPGVADSLRNARRAGIVSIPLRLPHRRRTVWLIAAAILLATAAAVGAAKLVLDLSAARIQVVPGSPSASATLDPGTLGTPVSLDRAREIAGFRPLVPAVLGPPDRVWVDEAIVGFEPTRRGPSIAMAWRPGPELPRIPGSPWGAVVLEFDGEANVAFKDVHSDTGHVEIVDVDGREAYWTGGEHELRLLTRDGLQTYLVRGNVLLWDVAGLTIRLETALPRARVVAIAESLD